MDCDKTEEVLTLEEIEKTRKKRKMTNDTFEKLPDSATEGLQPELVEELQYAYEILQTILSMSRIEPFLIKPDSNLFGLSSYYTVIKKPMWLDEVYRKLLTREYTCISEFIADLRLMLENCYRFWGSSHKFTRKGLRIEQKLEQKIDVLPQPIKEKCYLKDGYSGELVVKSENMEVVEESDKNEDHEVFFSPTFKGFQSKILTRVLESESNEEVSELTSEAQKDRESQMLSWEKDTLVTDEIREQIKSMWQLAEIGQFLKLTYEVLNVEEITQYEIERMLIMPRESQTLATLMTSMLSPATIRGNLDITPIMPYGVWTKRLKKRMDDWFSIFYKKCNFLETHASCGVDPHFWLVMNLQNPLDEKNFHDLTLFQRVWILKSLCNNLFHTNRCIQGLFSDEVNLNEMRQTNLGTSNDGFSYFYLPFFPEIRVYKQKMEEKAQYWRKLNIADNLVIRSFDSSVSYSWDDLDLTMTITPNENCFHTVADSMAALIELVDCTKKESNRLARALNQFLKQARKHKQSNEGLDALYTQWCNYQSRPTDYENSSIGSWEASTTRIGQKNNEPETVSEVLGKRRSKINLSFIQMGGGETSDEFDFYESESDISDWECELKKKKKTGRKTKANENHEVIEEKKVQEERNTDVEKKVLEELTEDFSDIKPQSLILNQNNSSEAIQEIEVKPVISKDGIVTEQLVPYMNESTTEQQMDKRARMKIVKNIKKEKDDDVISISSEEEIDIKPNINTLKATPQKAPSAVAQPQVYIPQNMTSNQRRSEPSILSNAQNIIRLAQPQQTAQIRNIWRQPMQMNNNMPVQNYPVQPGMRSPQNPQQGGVQLSGNMNYMQQRSPMSLARTRAPSPIHQMGTRMRSPYTPRHRSPAISSPSGMGPRNVARPPRMSPRNLFPASPASPASPKQPTLEGILEVGQKSDGSYGYHVRLPDGGIINLTRSEVDEIRKKNKGTLPHRVEVPRVKKPPSPILLR